MSIKSENVMIPHPVLIKFNLHSSAVKYGNPSTPHYNSIDKLQW
jgi:hypothetical protein